MRGYDAQADRVERLIGGLPGVAAAAESAFHAAAGAAGMATPGYTNRVDVALAPSMAAGPALARVLLRLLDTAQANVDGAVRDADTEFLHDLRVAVRRTRAALKLAGDALPDGVAARFAAEYARLRAVRRRDGPRRAECRRSDRDTRNAGLAAFADRWRFQRPLLQRRIVVGRYR